MLLSLEQYRKLQEQQFNNWYEKEKWDIESEERTENEGVWHRMRRQKPATREDLSKFLKEHCSKYHK